MVEILTITLPSTTSEDDMETILNTVKEIHGVEDADSITEMGVDPGTLMLWVQVAGAAVGVAGAAVPIIKQVIEMIRGKGISGAKITLPNGAVISADTASAAELERLMTAAGNK